MILHRAPVVLPVTAAPIRDGAVAVDGDRITWVGPAAAWTGDGRVVSWPGILMPGLVNAHCHLQYSAYADMCAPGVDFFVWITSHGRRNRRMTDADWRRSTSDGVAALLRTGTTSVADVTARIPALEVLASSGLGGISYVEAVGVDSAGWPAARELLLGRLAGAGTRAVGISPHTVYTLGSSVVRSCVSLARDLGLRLHPHAAESPYETEFVATGTGPFVEGNRRANLAMELVAAGGSGRTPVAELAALGALGPGSHIAHGVHCTVADRALLRSHGTAVALCPRSNEILGVGTAPVAAYRAEGNPVAVGTDSLASTPSLDLLADVAALRTIALDQGSPSPGLDRWLVEAATIGGARAMALADVGSLHPGARADLAIFDVPPDPDPYAAITAAAGTCVGTVLSGRITS